MQGRRTILKVFYPRPEIKDERTNNLPLISNIKTNIGHSVNAVVQLERRPGRRFVSEVVQINSFDADADEYGLSTIFATEKELA